MSDSTEVLCVGTTTVHTTAPIIVHDYFDRKDRLLPNLKLPGDENIFELMYDFNPRPPTPASPAATPLPTDLAASALFPTRQVTPGVDQLPPSSIHLHDSVIKFFRPSVEKKNAFTEHMHRAFVVQDIEAFNLNRRVNGLEEIDPRSVVLEYGDIDPSEVPASSDKNTAVARASTICNNLRANRGTIFNNLTAASQRSPKSDDCEQQVAVPRQRKEEGFICFTPMEYEQTEMTVSVRLSLPKNVNVSQCNWYQRRTLLQDQPATRTG